MDVVIQSIPASLYLDTENQSVMKNNTTSGFSEYIAKTVLQNINAKQKSRLIN